MPSGNQITRQPHSEKRTLCPRFCPSYVEGLQFCLRHPVRRLRHTGPRRSAARMAPLVKFRIVIFVLQIQYRIDAWDTR